MNKIKCLNCIAVQENEQNPDELCDECAWEKEEVELVWCGCGKEKVVPMDNGHGYCGRNQWCMP